ncbi:MAG: linked oxidase domain protein [Alphaproteobacteria bacterium]|nr:linked oxidase domain protein [Alphaproteobacteria bacterium]
MRLSGWGRYPVAECNVLTPGDAPALLRALDGLPEAIVRGNGRSYGDASLNPAATIEGRRLDRLIDFDPDTGLLVCEGGLLLAELIDVMLPRGWFPPVTPGTKLVTIGGMIASDVHGKNHHGAGSFCEHVEWLDLAIGDGSVLRCSAGENADLYAATCGGMGLTGAIARACFRLLEVETASVRQQTRRAPNLAHAFALLDESLEWTYSVAWIDCLAAGPDLGRSVILLGEHALPDELPAPRRAAPLARAVRRPKRVPIDFPALALSRPAVRIFNRLYYAAHKPGAAIVDIDRYFYPLDAIHDWNRIYGRGGFVQYQCVLPLAESKAGMTKLLTAIAAAGEASFLAVLKRFGGQSFGMLSFPMEGYTLALDFPANISNLALLDRLDAITREHGGRIYLAKDARTAADDFAAGYPRLEAFRAVRRRYRLDRHFSSLLSRRLEI